ncbi:amidohydrolase [Actinoplanes sp. HUAS TT8]|uniref:amidohydrolase n=1 Tax=Actinoplanes sp. HUAS TT8 TaxID=3447453 RepID=UPI003F524122
MIAADLLLTNARVITVDGPDASALAILGDRIVALDDVPARTVVDLGGATVVPGFHDAHNHMAWFGLTLSEADLRVPTLDAVFDALSRQAATTPAGQWVVGNGYDENKIGRHPTRDDLDRLCPGREVWLKHVSGHMCVVSSPVLQRLGLAERATEVDGGRVVTDAGGRPTGLLQERAQNLVGDLVMPYPLKQLTDAIDRAGRRYLREGVTSVVEAGIGGGWIGKSPVELAAYQNARDRGLLHVRTELMVAADVLHPLAAHPDDDLPLGLDLGLRTGFGDDWLRLGPVKVFTDGSLIGHTAAMCHEYADMPGETGALQGDPAAVARDDHRGASRRLASWWRTRSGDAAVDLTWTRTARPRCAPDHGLAEHPHMAACARRRP